MFFLHPALQGSSGGGEQQLQARHHYGGTRIAKELFEQAGILDPKTSRRLLRFIPCIGDTDADEAQLQRIIGVHLRTRLVIPVLFP